MKTAIVAYSVTGNTMKVAERIKSALKAKGTEADLLRVTAFGNSSQTITLENTPDISEYDRLIIGAPINGFMLCRAMKMYLKQHANLKGKNMNCFVTQHFKLACLGGNQGLKKMQELGETKGGKINHTSIVHWSSPNRETQIDEVVALMTAF